MLLSYLGGVGKAVGVDSEYAIPGARVIMSARVRSPKILATTSGGPIDVTSGMKSGVMPCRNRRSSA